MAALLDAPLLLELGFGAHFVQDVGNLRSRPLAHQGGVEVAVILFQLSGQLLQESFVVYGLNELLALSERPLLDRDRVRKGELDWCLDSEESFLARTTRGLLPALVRLLVVDPVLLVAPVWALLVGADALEQEVFADRRIIVETLKDHSPLVDVELGRLLVVPHPEHLADVAPLALEVTYLGASEAESHLGGGVFSVFGAGVALEEVALGRTYTLAERTTLHLMNY